MAAHRHNKAGVTQANQALRAVVDVSRRNGLTRLKLDIFLYF